jgi:hypothetical protein
MSKLSFSNPYLPTEPDFKNLSKTPGNIKQMMDAELKPVGRVYLRDTGATCIDVSGVAVERVKRYSIMDYNQGKSLLESAAIDISNSAVQQSSVKCAKVTIEERDIGSKSKTRENTQYVALDEILQARPTIFKNQKKPVFVNEGFVSMENMNAGQRAFIGAATVIALYLYFKVVEK